MNSPEPQIASMSFQWDIEVTSLRNLLRALHDFLNERGYMHEDQLPEAECNAIHGMTGFKDELICKRDTTRRDRAYLVFGIILLPTILLTTLGISFISQSRYTLRTIVSISVEGEAHIAENSKQGPVQSEVLNAVSDARITVYLRAGTARGDMDIWKPADTKREVMRLVEERRRLEEGLSELLLGID